MKKIFQFVSVLTLLIIAAGCASAPPHKTSLELQAIQSREFETSKKTAFASTISVFQDLGYTVSSADLETGFITAKSPTKGGIKLFVGASMTDTKATAFIEELQAGKIKIRLNFVESEQVSGAYGQHSGQDRPIENPTVYQNAFTKIQEAIFIRTQNK